MQGSSWTNQFQSCTHASRLRSLSQDYGHSVLNFFFACIVSLDQALRPNDAMTQAHHAVLVVAPQGHES
jgi:hypothetical protein